MTSRPPSPAKDPWALWRQVAERASRSGLREPSAVALATADSTGRPSVRMVLARLVDERGFVFFTNATSRKGEELRANPRAALCFYWDPLHEQVRAEGPVEKIAEAESDAYWRTRSREAQIGAWGSAQSRTTPSRQALEAQVASVHLRFAGEPVPRPPHWHGYRLHPERIEFWAGRPGRLHERRVFDRVEGEWRHSLLQP